MHIFGCLLLFLFSIVFIVIALFGNVLKVLFGLRKMNKNFQKAAEQAQKRQTTQEFHSGTQQNTGGGSTHRHKAANKGKIFPKDEGEYIDFEEVK